MKKNIYVNGEYVKLNPSYHTEDSPWKTKQILKMLDKHALKPDVICEFGCGAGEILRQLQAHLPENVIFYGYEISPQAFDLSKQRENETLHFYLEDMLSKNDLPLMDVLLCIDVFEHIEDYLGFLGRLRQKMDCKIIFHIPLDISVQSVLQGTLPSVRAAVGHLHYFTKETALLTLMDSGFEIIDYFYTPSSNEVGKTFKSKLAKFPRMVFSWFSPDLAVRVLGGYSLMVLVK